MVMDKIALEKMVEAALREDISWGDVTTESLIPTDSVTTAKLVSKSNSVVCGLLPFSMTFSKLDPNCTFIQHVEEGTLVEPGTEVVTVTGKTRAILTAERTALNFFNHMSGIATMTRRVASILEGTDCRVVDTRKTLPLLRMIEKYAVKVGGAQNHRHDLSQLVLIKDNHIQAVGSVGEAVRRAANSVSFSVKIECEVTNLGQALEAVEAGADILLFDNMQPFEISEAISQLPEDIYFEASGNISPNNCLEYAKVGVDFISMGRLTHSAPYADFSLEF
jgi:nicotinate-nucleotide pyrophosphorylase (carboxylating)